MSTTTKYELLEAMMSKYKIATKSLKKQILDEYCSICGYNRKYAIRLFNSSVSSNSIKNLSKRGRKKIYDDPIILEVIRYFWVKTNLPCSKRLKAIIPLWLPFYDKHPLSQIIKQKILNISPSTIDRLMGNQRAKFNKLGLSTTKPGSILKKHIPVKTQQWDEKVPGYLEADTVAHCGTSVAGMFVYTVNTVDIASQWTEQRAVWGKGEKGVREAVENIEQHLPFSLKGFDCDNGSEFLNWHLLRFFLQRKQKVHFTRSRAYQKNDNAHIENKNWTHVRQYLGYQRFDKKQLVDLINDLYKNEWNLYFNFFIPSVKLIQKERVGSKIIKKYDKPKTPYQRLLESDDFDLKTKNELINQFEKLNPLELQKEMMNKIKNIINSVNEI